MNIDLITVGKTDSAEVAALVEMYAKRIARRVRFGIVAVPDVRRGSSTRLQTKAEGESLMKQFAPDDWVVLLDDKGAQPTSMEFAAWLERRLAAGGKRICFVVGGPYGFSPEVRRRADETLSLSRMTFSHQIVRAIFAEQLYRAFSIINNEPYHNE